MRSFKDIASRALGTIIPTLGEEIEYRPLKGGRYSMRGVYDDEYVSIDPNTNTEVSSNIPRVGVRYSDLIEPPQKGDKVYIRGELFEVYDSQEDGQAGTTLYISRIETDESYERST